MPTATWIIVADAARARIFATDHELVDWVPVRDLVHPQSRTLNSDLVSDTQAPHTRRGARSGPSHSVDRHDFEGQRFAKELATSLQGSLDEGSFADFVLVAPPQMMGWVRNELGKQLTERIRGEITKDYSLQPPQELRASVRRKLAEQVVAK